jgi:hypothetical protein
MYFCWIAYDPEIVYISAIWVEITLLFCKDRRFSEAVQLTIIKHLTKPVKYCILNIVSIK